MKNLNKENCWNEIEAKYPDQFSAFASWIDFYKLDNNWKELFSQVEQVKFHDLPLAMQIGILIEYFAGYMTAMRIPKATFVIDFPITFEVYKSYVFNLFKGAYDASVHFKQKPL